MTDEEERTAVEVGREEEMATQQFLNNALSQRGPSSLPYAEDVKWLLRQHLVSLIDGFPSLYAETATFTHNDGRSLNLLRADGTIPMNFQGVTYNIPVVIWLMESYPQHPPCVYVNPTRDMIIKRPHPHVNPSGLVSIPYLQNWIYPSSCLLDLARHLSAMFGRDPPVYSRQRPNPNPNPTPPTNPSVYSSISSTSIASRPSTPQGAYPPSPYASAGGGRIATPSPPEDPAEVYRRNAIHKLAEALHADIGVLRKAREAEMEGLFGVQSLLRRRDEQISRGLKEMLDEKEALEQKLQIVLMNSDVMDAWLKANEGKMANLGISDVDDAFEPCDALSQQMLNCTAQDLAIEDVVYSLDKAVQEGSVPFDQYLRSVRLLSREQFFHRATAAKIRAAQMQAHVANMAARASFSS